MSIVRKVKAVEKLFRELNKDVQELQQQTGMHCIENCIKCCTTPRIYATALEFYPMAYRTYLSGQAEALLEHIERTNDASICPLLVTVSVNNSRTGCSQYDHRGMICRLFTYNYAKDKRGIRKLSACKTMRMDQPAELDKANEILLKRPLGPHAPAYYARLQDIDFNEGQRLYPIGEAIKQALETVLSHFRYRGNKAG